MFHIILYYNASIKHLLEYRCASEERKIFLQLINLEDIVLIKNFNLFMFFLKKTNLFNRIEIFHILCTITYNSYYSYYQII